MNDDLRQIIQNEVLFAREAAEFLNVSTQRLNQLVHTGILKPIKQGASGTLFLKADLEERIKDSKNLCGEIRPSLELKKLQINMAYLLEAISYYTIQSFFKFSDKNTEPVFRNLSAKVDFSLPMSKISKEIGCILNIDESKLVKAYETVYKGFENLNQTDYVVKRGTELYPQLLEKTADAPPYLFMRGNPDLLKNRIVAVVGTRHPSDTGREKAYRLSKMLGKAGIVVSSGLARGIDTAAHNAALECNQLTISVIGTPITNVYPKENEKLQQAISEQGLVISQFPPSAKVQRWHFPMRNAVMSGISLATAIIEASETSGALIQARYAIKQARKVFIPQSALDNPNISWPNKLIKQPGAAKFSKIEELLKVLEESDIIIKPEIKQISLFPEGEDSAHVHRS